MTSSKHTPDRTSKLPDRLTTFEKPRPNRNGCLKRDRQWSLSVSPSSRSKKPARTPPSTSLFLPMKLSNSVRGTYPSGPSDQTPRTALKPEPTKPNLNPKSPLRSQPKAEETTTFSYPLLAEREDKIVDRGNQPTNPPTSRSPSVRRVLGEAHLAVKRFLKKLAPRSQKTSQALKSAASPET